MNPTDIETPIAEVINETETTEDLVDRQVLTTEPIEEVRPKRRQSSSSKGFEPAVSVEPVAAATTIRFEDLQIEESDYNDVVDTLPHGIWCEGHRLRDFTCKPYSSEVDLRIGKLYNGQRPDIKNILTNSLDDLVETIGGMTLDEISRKCSITKSQLIEQMVLGDVITLVHGCKVNTSGWEIAIEDNCPNCRTRHKDNPKEGSPYHDVGLVKTGIVENDLSDRLVVEVQLEQGFMLHGERCKTVHMRPIRLYELSQIQKMERGTMDLRMAQAQICAIPESSKQNIRGTIFSDKAIESMGGEVGLRDRSLLIKVSSELTRIGPQMAVDVVCDNCGTEWSSQLMWANLRSYLYTMVEAY